MDKTKILQNIAKKGNITVAELEKELADILNTLPPSSDKEAKAFNELNNRHSSGSNDKTVKFQIVVFALGRVSDFSASTVDEAMKAYNSNQAAALESGRVKLIDGRPVVIDLAATFNDGKIKNNNYGKPLLPSYNRNIQVFAKEPGQSEFVLTKMALRNDFATENVPDQMCILDTNCLGDIAKGLKTGKSTKFVRSSEKVDINALVQKYCKKNVVLLGDALDDARKWVGVSEADRRAKGFYDRFIITSGTVKFITDATGKQDKNGNPQSHSGAVDDYTTDKLASIFVDQALPCPDKDATYTFIAQSSIGKEQKKNDDGAYVDTGEDKLVLNIMGYFP